MQWVGHLIYFVPCAYTSGTGEGSVRTICYFYVIGCLIDYWASLLSYFCPISELLLLECLLLGSSANFGRLNWVINCPIGDIC